MSPARSVKRVCLSYSGGLDTSVILRWLIERYRCEVVTFTADIGQEEELSGVPEKARATGAVDCVVRDVREEFVRDYVFPALRGNAVYEGHYLLGTALARPLIAKHQAEVARATGCDAVAHGATGKGNDQVRFELAFRALAPELTVIAPWREWDLRSRTDCIAYAQKHSIPITVTLKKPYSMDRNLMHVSYEGGILEDPWRAPDEDMFILTRSPERAPDEPVELVIGFEQGTPVTLDGESLDPCASPRQAQSHRRYARGGPGGHGRESLRGAEVARRLRDARGQRAARGASRGRIDHDGPRRDARAGPPLAALRGDDLQRLLVRSGDGIRAGGDRGLPTRT